ncbi:glycosyltransferase family 4 protein [Chitinophagaceae bacterium MMS25-I14]
MAKVLILADELCVGGVSTFIISLSKGLSLAGHDVTVLLFVKGGEKEKELDGHVQLVHLDVSFLDTRYMVTRRLQQIIQAEGYSTVFFNNCYYADSHCLRGLRVQGLFVIHGNSNAEIRRFLKEGIYCNVLVAVSPAVEQMCRQYLPEYELAYIPHGTEVPPSLAVKNQDHFNIVYLGRISEEKGASLLPDIIPPLLNRHPDMRFILIGNNDTDYSQHIVTALHDQTQDAKQLSLLPAAVKTEIEQELNAAAVLLGPSFTEAFGLSFLEGAAHGAVPVISLIPGVTDVIFEHEKNAVLVPAGRPDGFVAGILKVYGDRERLKRLSAAAYEHVKRHYSIDTMIAGYCRLIETAGQEKNKNVVRHTRLQRLYGLYRCFLLLKLRKKMKK